MPRQEDRLLDRIQRIKTIIKDCRKIELEELEAWALLNLGIKARTVASYTKALLKMGILNYDPETEELIWIDVSAMEGVAKYDE